MLQGRGDSELTAVNSTKNNKFITATSGQVRLGYIMLHFHVCMCVCVVVDKC